MNKMKAREFVERWRDRGDEQAETQKFWDDFLVSVMNVSMGDVANNYIDYERRVHGRRIDGFMSDRKILIEQKSFGIDLDEPRDNGKYGLETPFQQAMWYTNHLVNSERPNIVIVCDFQTFRIYDLNESVLENSYVEVTLDNLPDSLYLFEFLVSNSNSRIIKEEVISEEAGEWVSTLYESLSKQFYHLDEETEQGEKERHSINVLIVRLIFLLYAEDAGLLQSTHAFGDFVQGDSKKLSTKLKELFRVLDEPVRDEYEDEELSSFPYINGGLFKYDDRLIIPQMTDLIAVNIIEASKGFNWSDISPTIFGNIFESTVSSKLRGEGGMHYTSIKNIHALIRPLFLDELEDEFRRAAGYAIEKKRLFALTELQDKIANLKFLDPACGSGNFLTETYLQLRKLENRIIEERANIKGSAIGQTALMVGNPIKVSINQFYGIEIDSFAVSVAKTALWISEEQMLEKTQELLPQMDFDFLPLKNNDNIVVANAMGSFKNNEDGMLDYVPFDWNEVLSSESVSYIIGNPPFLGARRQSKTQKKDVMTLYKGVRGAGNIDYCAAWFMKAALYANDSNAACAFVSTNSICQGEQVAPVWEPIFKLGYHIDFAHTTFRWTNKARDMAHVFCIIVGFSKEIKNKNLYIHPNPDTPAVPKKVKNINAYLKPAANCFVQNISKPICDVPKMGIGNKPIDGGNYLFTPFEMEEFIEKEPESAKYFHPWIGAKEFLQGQKRYCLWLGDIPWKELSGLPECMQIIRNVREFRLASKSAGTRKIADTPTRFHVENMPTGYSILVPETSSERRKYIPIGFISPNSICSNAVKLVPDATLYHFGVLSSSMHNAWMRVVAGRLESRYRYSAGVVYNNFIWPNPSLEQIQEIEDCAQMVLDIRERYVEEQEATLADLYDPDNEVFFPDLFKAHDALDKAVEEAYGVEFNGDEEKIAAHLFKLYEKKVNEQ